jgi:hypothetical protein
MDEFRQSDELVAEREAYEAEQEMKNRKFRARCIQWDRTDDDGSEVEVDLPAEVVVTLEDLQLPYDAYIDEVEDALAVYLADYYGFCHNGFFFEEVED